MNNTANNSNPTNTSFPLQDYEFFGVSWGGYGDEEDPTAWYQNLILVNREAADAWFDDLVKTANKHHRIEWVQMSECRVDGFGAIQGLPGGETLREFDLYDSENN